jgi:hypothetical protein
MRMALVVVVLACSGPRPAPAVPTMESVESAPSGAPRAVTAETVCRQYLRLLPTCEPLSRARWSAPSCVDYWREVLQVASENPQRHAPALTFAACLARNDECDAAMDCIMADQFDPTKELRACDDHSEGSHGHAVGLSRAAWTQRKGAGITSFRDASSTKAVPIEMCGVGAATEWLTTLQCDDRTRPLPERRDAANARAGNVGPGGRCQSIIDHYRVTCPEASYEIYIDAYVCPRPD